MRITKMGIDIIPESGIDVIYIEKHLGLKKDEDSVKCIRRDAVGSNRIWHLEIYSNV
jgi:hypothetical protein